MQAGPGIARERESAACGPFTTGAQVLVTLSAPREKFWGALVALSATGVTLVGVDLNSFDDFVRMVRAGEPAACSVVFFPLHRVERAELDAGVEGLPSLHERFEQATGRPVGETLAAPLLALVRQRGASSFDHALLVAALELLRGDLAHAASLLQVSEAQLRSWLA